jgi:shikimate dehydrogenase
MAVPRSHFFHLGLTGYPLGHSLSPALHQAALLSLGLGGEYRLYPVAPGQEGNRRLAGLVEKLRRGELDGLNMTIPHKQALLSLVDELTPTARAIQAANTLYCRKSRVIGHNTDVDGFCLGVQSVLPPGIHPEASTAVVLGAGGSARAVVYGLARAGWRVIIAARRLEQAQTLAGELGASSPAGKLSAIHLDGSSLASLERVGLVVNTTPVGMFPAVDASPWLAGVPLPEGAAIYDLVYNPAETVLVRSARASGLRAETGLGMLVEQAVLGFECWTGSRPSKAAMKQAAELQLQSSTAAQGGKPVTAGSESDDLGG